MLCSALISFALFCCALLCTGVDKHLAKVVFALSQISVIDELKRRQRAVSLMFFDFVEVGGALGGAGVGQG